MSAILIAICVFVQSGTMVSSQLSTTDFFPDSANNLTSITWAHAVNDVAYLERVLQSNTMMIEADIVMGTLVDDPSRERIPVMAHPPAETSDLSLNQFLTKIGSHNAIEGVVRKGVKLDFKSIEVFEDSLSILELLYDKADYPIWLNADILAGPVDSQVIPVNAPRFLSAAAKFSKTTLSIGWTTLYGGGIDYGIYSDAQIDEMLSTITDGDVENAVTFPVRAGIAANCLDQMLRLLSESSRLQSTLTIWSSDGDFVDIPKLRNLILTVGLNKVYLDVPDAVSEQLNLPE